MERMDKIGNLTPYSRGVNLVAKVVSKSETRTVGSQYDQTQHQLADALIADETGAISLVLWDDNIEKVNVGDAIKVSNAFVKIFRGKIQLNLGRFGKVEAHDEQLQEVNTDNNLSERAMPQRSLGPTRRRRRGGLGGFG